MFREAGTSSFEHEKRAGWGPLSPLPLSFEIASIGEDLLTWHVT
jgi:hypothetical protein